jgi:hypothetical protein
MKIQKSWVLLALVAVALAAISFPLHRARADGDARFQFNITPAASGAPAAHSLAEDKSVIFIRGTGTFQPDDPEEVTGGGTWETQDSSGKVTGSGSWQPTRLVKWNLGPGAVSNPAVKGGLAFFQIKYSDGARGMLAVSCFLPGAPPSVSEGIIASKDFILYGGHVHTPPTFFVALSDSENEK